MRHLYHFRSQTLIAGNWKMFKMELGEDARDKGVKIYLLVDCICASKTGKHALEDIQS